MIRHALALIIGFTVAWTSVAAAQNSPATPPAGTPAAQPAGDKGDPPPLKPEELEQMLAPIALYPDSLLTQVLMGATYPLEIVEADRWVKAHKTLKGDALAKALEDEDWDPSVKSLVNFPDVLAMLSDKLSWTQKLGDAFIAQQKDVLDTVQKLRAKAKENGKLESTPQQTVTVEQQAATQVIVIESKSPEVIYVPSYNPAVVYGTWPYPAYPPYPYYPPGYVASNVVSFGLGVACGVAWGYAWGNCNWGHSSCDIDINRNTNINNNIDRSKYKNQVNQRGGQNGRGSWQHDSAHRKGVGYRDQGTAQKFGGTSTKQAAQSREAYRGRAESGRQDINNRGADNIRAPSNTQRPSNNAQRPSNNAQRPANNSSRPSTTQRSSSGSGGGLSGSSNSGASTRASSSRGNTSRSSGSSGSRSSGGGSRGGGGRGGGGRR